MDEVQYPAQATIAAFGGTTKTAAALGINKQNVNKWKSSPSGLIPRWWSDRIRVRAEANGIRLPKPKRIASKTAA